MDIAAISIRNKTVTLVLSFVMLIGGFIVYSDMSRLEDPKFTIKEALVITPYAGASAEEVEEEVTDVLETSIQQMGQLLQVRSQSTPGLSTITVEIKDKFDNSTLPQVWDELRRKVHDVSGNLPPGTLPSIVLDDYGDVYGVFLAITGDGYSYAELKEYVDELKRELLLVADVGKVSVLGERQEAIYVDFSREQLAALEVSLDAIVEKLNQRNAIVDAGSVRLANEYISIVPTGSFDSVKQIESLLISGSSGQQFFLRDIAQIRRAYVEPQDAMIRYDGMQGIGLGISTVDGGNVITMGDALSKRLIELEGDRPIGMEIGFVSYQPKAVTNAIDGFVVSLIEAVLIVVLVLLMFMGLRSALIIGFVLLLTIAGSFIFLNPMGVALERISLGALIIALGMLVDNAIVVVDGMLVRMKRGLSAEAAASEIVKQSMWPLLGATLIAVMAFASIGTSNDSTGEFCRSLFQVVMVSLLLSWVTAITITPLLGVMFLKANEEGETATDPYAGGFYSAYRSFLGRCLKYRLLTILAVLGMFTTSLWGFTKVDQSFFPSSTRPQFMVDVWLPQGSHIDETERQIKILEKRVLEQEGIEHVTSTIGRGALRFTLTYAPEQSNTAYAQLLVDVVNKNQLSKAIANVNQLMKKEMPNLDASVYRFEVGPGGKGKIEARFIGPDEVTLRGLAEQAKDIIAADHDARALRTDWRDRVKVIEPVISEDQANLNGISREMIATAIRIGFEGQNVGAYREKELLIPILVRSGLKHNADVSSLENLQIWSPAAGKMIPLRQVVSSFRVRFDDGIIHRRDRKRSISVFADPTEGYATELLGRVRPDIEALHLPIGYTLEWGGEFEDTAKAQAGIGGSIPVFVIFMILITIVLFNSLRIPVIIWSCVPLALIGVTAGLLISGESFGFMALLGFLSLMGMLIKNEIVLIDEINFQLSNGKALIPAIIDSGASRLRPVAMAALTTALGMIPLIFDDFFSSMAITIIGGLMFATLLTMIIVPVLYAVFFSSKNETAENA